MLQSIVINSTADGAVITVYDGVDDTGRELGVIEPSVPVTLFYGITLNRGLFVVVSVAAANFNVILADLTNPASAVLPLIQSALTTAASATVVGPDSFGSPSDPGSSTTFSRGDHDHGLPDGGGGGGTDFTGAGSPEGVQDAARGQTYEDTTNGGYYVMTVDGGSNTGWMITGGALDPANPVFGLGAYSPVIG